jgi:hypothetical protein
MSTNAEGGRPSAEEVHLHDVLEHEAGRLAHHPREEIHRLREEAESGESGATIGIVLTAIALWVTAAVILVLGLAFLAYYLSR